MNYEEMSDFDINKMIAENLGVYFSRHEDDDSDVCIKEFNKHDKSKWILTIANYCNNPSDAWPIIVENGISLIKLPSGWQAVSKWDYIDLCDFDDINECCIGHSIPTYGHQKPLRAAMIVYLMMQEAK